MKEGFYHSIMRNRVALFHFLLLPIHFGPFLSPRTAPLRRDLWPWLLAAATILFVVETVGSALYRRLSPGGLRRTSNS